MAMTPAETFSHDFSDERYQEALLGLFQPGSGVAPPKLAGRGRETKTFLNKLLRPLQGGRGPTRDLVLYGPRGNGKTVLLADFRRQARADQIGVLALTRRVLKSPADLARALLNSPSTGQGALTRAVATAVDTAQRAVARNLAVDGVTVGAPSLGTVSLGAVSAAALTTELVARLTARCGEQPLLVTVDEAHTLDCEVGQDLLNLSQQLRTDGIPFGLILVGTPNLEARLGEMDATFWSRAEILPIGRLNAQDTATALTEPLADWSVTFNPAALETVVDDCQGYPYFTQLWGEALCEALVDESQGHTVTPATVAQMYAQVDARRQRYYGERYQELEDRDLVKAADIVAGVFADIGQAHKAALLTALQEALGLEVAAASAALGQLAALGYTWRVTSANDWFEPGIPSLMAHVQTRLQDAIAHTAPPGAARP